MAKGSSLSGVALVFSGRRILVWCVVGFRPGRNPAIAAPRAPKSEFAHYFLQPLNVRDLNKSGLGKSGKSEFPTDWDDARILREIADVADDPTSTAPRAAEAARAWRGRGVDIRSVERKGANSGACRSPIPTHADQ